LAFISEFNVQMLYLPGFKKCCRFFVIAAAAVALIDLAMAAEQNCCPETQRLLDGSSLTIAFRQAHAQSLVGNISRVFPTSGVGKILKIHFFLPAQHFPPWEACLPVTCFF
jgi:hypothetical protein